MTEKTLKQLWVSPEVHATIKAQAARRQLLIKDYVANLAKQQERLDRQKESLLEEVDL